MEIPCETCPVFAICKEREIIECSILMNYYLSKKKLGRVYRSEALENIKKTLTNLMCITTTQTRSQRVIRIYNHGE